MGQPLGGLVALARQPAFAGLLERLIEEPGQAWTLENMAACAGLSRSAFFKRFNELAGQSPGQVLLALRMRQACQLLKAGNTVEQVGGRVGYQSVAAFTRAFAKAVGVQPGLIASSMRGGRGRFFGFGFGFGFQGVGFDRCMRIRRRWRLLVTFPPLRRPTLVLAKVGKAASLPSYGPCAALRGPSLRCLPGPRGLRLAAQVYISRLRLTPKGAAHQGPPVTSTRPPEVAICVAWTIARLEARANRSRADQEQIKSRSRADQEQIKSRSRAVMWLSRFSCCLCVVCSPYRRQAGSHRYSARLKVRTNLWELACQRLQS
jgi:AraC-like DNA-binding protein